MSIRSVVNNVTRTPSAVALKRRFFKGSASYWEDRYSKGGTSGPGSYGRQAEWKAGIVNEWVAELGVTSIVDFGCGDGNQLSLADYPRYLGLDRSSTAVRKCIARFADDKSKSFLRYDPEDLADPAAWLRGDMALSQEVIFHLVEDEVFEDYMTRLFAGADRYVVICCNDTPYEAKAAYERHRDFTKWIEQHQPEWKLERRTDPPADVEVMSSFFLYQRV